jgi:hypothetical protein
MSMLPVDTPSEDLLDRHSNRQIRHVPPVACVTMWEWRRSSGSTTLA